MINKKGLAGKIAGKTCITKKEAIQVVDLLFEEIVEELESGGEVSIVGFGKFYLYQHSPRPVRNPKTQEEMILKPYKSVKFKVSDKLKKNFKGVG
jgi:nucleoid DNA-binding protein